MAPEMKPCSGCGQLVRTDAKACAYCKTSVAVSEGAWAAAQASRCDVVDFNGNQCALQTGHAGQHGAALATTKPPPSFARVIVTPVIVMIAAYLIGIAFVGVLPALVVGAVVSIAYVLVASRV